MQTANIVIAGSLNLDLIAQVERAPQLGETLPGSQFVTLPGGKGANQACAVGRLGRPGAAAMIGCVGQDAYGRQLLESLRACGVDNRYVRGTPEAATGIAMILVEADRKSTRLNSSHLGISYAV